LARFKVGDNEYRSDKLDAFAQFHISRRLLPVLTSFGDILLHQDAAVRAAIMGGDADDPAAQELVSAALLDLDSMRPTLEAIAKMPDDDANYVLHGVLKVTHRANVGPGGEIVSWSPVFNTNAKRVMYDDIELMEMLQILRAVLTESLGRFFSAPQSTLNE
jgi:hypothetical protein